MVSSPGPLVVGSGAAGQRIHDDEADTSEATVRSLLEDQCPHWAGAPLAYLSTSGTDNAMWLIEPPDGPTVVARLPRIQDAADSVAKEIELLPLLGRSSLGDSVATPTLRHAGVSTPAFPHQWAVFDWIDGVDAWTARHELERTPTDLAVDLARSVRAIGALAGLPVQPRTPGDRGGPLTPLLRRLERWLTDPRWSAGALLDLTAIRRSAAESAEVSDESVDVSFVHGDLIPGNLVVRGGRLSAIIDWGGAAYADPAQDLAPAWAVLDRGARSVFRSEVGADDATWLRARAFELEHAVGGVLYYTPRNHRLADVMARTLDRILVD